MNGCIKDTLGYMNDICNDDNICNALYLRCLTNTTSCYDHHDLYLIIYKCLPYVGHVLEFISSLTY